MGDFECTACGAPCTEFEARCARCGAHLGHSVAEPQAPSDRVGDAELGRTLAGSAFGHYRIEERIGSGGMGVVYLARDVRLGRRVALKVLAPHLCRDAQARARMLREARAAGELDHPAVATVFEAGEHDGRPFIAMPFYDGESLRERIARGPVPVATAARICADVASGLAAAHRAGIVHRDVKPANVLTTREGAVKIADFGLAKIERDAGLTAAGAVIGTLSYMAPEQIRGEALDARADLFALGVMLHELVTGSTPFGSSVQRILDDPAPALEARGEAVPAELEHLHRELLAKDPSRRPSSADEVAAALRAVVSALRGPSEAALDRGEDRHDSRVVPRGPRRPSTTPTALGGLFRAAEDTGPGTRGRGRLDAMERAEVAEAVLRTRNSFVVAFFLWAAFLALDAAVVAHLGAGAFTRFAAIRLAALALVTPAFVRLYRKPAPSPRLLSILDVYCYTVPAIGVAAMAAEFGGLASPYGPGVCVVLLARSVTIHYPWRRGLVMTGIPVLAFVTTLLGSALVSERIAAQMRDPAALTAFAVTMAYVLGTYLFLVLGGHIVWALRRQIFEARDIGRYRLERRIGAGGMGEVWVAHHAGLKRDVALKILRPDRLDPSAAARFEREVRATSELVHPNTVRIFDYGVTEDGISYYAMELLVGETMQALVKRSGALAPARALSLVGQAARALGEAHARGIVHRDVKPENLFVTSLGGEDDFVKVLDFGIAKLAEGDGTVTQTGWLMGTPSYISPEVAAGQPADARSDVYALGAVLYFLVSGHDPFEESNPGALLFAHIHQRPRLPSDKLGRPLPAELERVVMRALEKSPADRYGSGAELAAALAACSEALARAAAPALPASGPRRGDVALQA